jgi:hypothetical protein
MDPIHPIAPGPPIFPQTGPEPVRRVERLTRERRREQEQQRKARELPLSEDDAHDGDDDEHPHIDVRA